ncbi:hypothetical protein BH24PSE2_BH24PSE2_12880 [soil metagenome]
MKWTSDRATYLWLAIIVVIALGLRVWGIWFGLPFSYRADEYHEVFRALELGSGSFNFDRTGKGGYFYVLFIEYGLLFIVLKIAGVVSSVQDFAKHFVQDPSSFYLIGRTTTAVIGTVNVVLAYRLGARAYSTGAGMLAAAFLAVDFLSAEHSHFITVDIPMTCLATASLLFAVRLADGGTSTDYKWAAFFAALATTTKVPAIMLVVPLLIAHYFCTVSRGSRPTTLFLSRDLWLAVAIFGAVWVVTNPGLIVHPPVPALFGTETVDGTGLEAAMEEPSTASPPNLFIYYAEALRDSLGWPLFTVALAGTACAVWRRRRADIILLSFGAIFYVVFAASQDPYLYFPRYLLPVNVILVVLAGRFLNAIWPRGRPARQVAGVIAVAALGALPAYRTVANNQLLIQEDTRTVAKNWIENNVPQGSRIFIEGLKIEPTRLTVPLDDTADNIRRYIEFYQDREPGKAKYLRYKLQARSANSYDLELGTPSEIRENDLMHYKRMGIQYLVIRPEAFSDSRKLAEGGVSFLNQLTNDPDVSLMRSFSPGSRERSGPLIHVYRVDPNVRKRPTREGAQP